MSIQDGSTVWESNTVVGAGLTAVLTMEVSGDLVLRDSTGQQLWHTDTQGELNAEIRGTGTLVIEDSNSNILWTT